MTLKARRRDRAELEGRSYTPIIDGAIAWDQWAWPVNDKGEFDDKAALIGDDLIAPSLIINYSLSLVFSGERPAAARPLNIKSGRSSRSSGMFRSGYILRDVLEQVKQLSFNSQDSLHELSSLYGETRIRRMGNAGRNGGEYYTPRPLIRAMIKVINPRIGRRSMMALSALLASCVKPTKR